uniref:tRNA dimethylallyltransferase n=1 Tax=Chlorobium chlorochromatii (strain CaD3) TaxID=340177 RepID=MIAA_CHLCH|nr:RecName: Full=tRNA dimethylallyltransferase; AltName: Full=Dimethylallyl diphosphate:tRNA dimethylallyltransferase; Short=DMAPP:tRNA dimethylallyltransferase; Short=DMATase; AltName: Full=Isopentenyl-diphosphate:tRNA isopentenyltransferase; Short=IPP transferase; Short=IPPT; Short=IPTase [Chlorobium chlorochromatii CaD3]
MATSAMHHPPIVVLAGATASGKSALAMAIAKKIGAEIISADSRQIYWELTIGAAKPSPKELQEVPHHFINEKHIGEPFTAGDFAVEAWQRITAIHQRDKRVVVAGGSTLYVEGLLKGFANLPSANEAIRQRLETELQTLGSEALYQRLVKLDPTQAATLDATKTQRLIRSLEIIESSGTSVTALKAAQQPPPSHFTFLPFALFLPRETLYQRINQRVDDMMANGLLHEAEALYQTYCDTWQERNLSALRTVGYQELFAYFEGRHSLDEAINLIKQHTRNYAKRQITFFSNHLALRWIEQAEMEEIVEQHGF